MESQAHRGALSREYMQWKMRCVGAGWPASRSIPRSTSSCSSSHSLAGTWSDPAMWPSTRSLALLTSTTTAPSASDASSASGA
eukprot:453234-Prymnesium_polylepis.1